MVTLPIRCLRETRTLQEAVPLNERGCQSLFLCNRNLTRHSRIRLGNSVVLLRRRTEVQAVDDHGASRSRAKTGTMSEKTGRLIVSCFSSDSVCYKFLLLLLRHDLY